MSPCRSFILPSGKVFVLLFWLVMFLLGVLGRFRLKFLQFVPLSVLVALLRSPVFGWVAGLLSSDMSLSVVLWLVSFALTLGLGIVRCSSF